MVSAGKLAEGTSYLEMLNEQNTRIINILQDELRNEREINRALLKKVGIIEEIRQNIDMDILHPIGGYKSLSERIREAEEKSLKEAESLENAKSN
jgi:hypothetical protein